MINPENSACVSERGRESEKARRQKKPVRQQGMCEQPECSPVMTTREGGEGT